MTARRQRRYRGPIENYRPVAATRRLLDRVQQVLAELAAEDLLPASVRTVYYRLLGGGVDRPAMAKSDGLAGRVADHIGNARRAGWIDWSAIVDGNLIRRSTPAYDDVDDFRAAIADAARAARIDLLAGQRYRPLVWCEAVGLIPLLFSVADEYGVEVISTSGYDSTTARHLIGQEAAERIARTGQTTVILHVGDHDHDGRQIYTAMEQDVLASGGHYDHRGGSFGGVVDVRRLAVTPEQIAEWKLPDDPDKPGSVQAEAISPVRMRDLLREAIEDLLDPDLMAARRAEQQVFHDRLLRVLGIDE